MTLPVTIKQVNLQDFIPSVVLDTVTAVSPIGTYLSGVNDIAKATAELLREVPPNIPSTDPVVLGISTALTALTSLINDLRNTGLSMLFVPPLTGSLNGWVNHLRSNLLNTRDPKRPNFTDDAAIWAWGVFAFSPQNSVTEQISNLIRGSFVSDTVAAHLLSKETFKKNLNYFPSTIRNQLAATPKPLPDSPWLSFRAVDVIPGAEKLLGNIQAFLTAVNSTQVLDATDKYISFLNKTSAAVTTILNDVTATSNFLQNQFPSLPLVFFSTPDIQIGGTKSLVDSLSVWFDRKSPDLSFVPDNAYITGMLQVGGSETPDEAAAQFTVIKDVILSAV